MSKKLTTENFKKNAASRAKKRSRKAAGWRSTVILLLLGLGAGSFGVASVLGAMAARGNGSAITEAISGENVETVSGLTKTEELKVISDEITMDKETDSEVDPETDSESDSETDSESDSEVVLPAAENLRILAVNPGFTVDGAANTGEMIELINLSGKIIALGGLKIIYVNSKGNLKTIIEFEENSYFVGETTLLRYSGSPEVKNLTAGYDATYATTLAMEAQLYLEYPGDDADEPAIFSAVCWTGKTDCAKKFSSSAPTTLVYNFATEEYEHLENYEPEFDAENPGLYIVADDISSDDNDDSDSANGNSSIETTDQTPDTVCGNLRFSEIFTYYEDSAEEQFLEIYNESETEVDLNLCGIRYKNKIYSLTETNALLADNAMVLTEKTTALLLADKSYYTFRISGTTFTKNPNKSNEIEIVDLATETSFATLVYEHGQKKNVALAYFGQNKDGTENWQYTYALTPGAENIYQQYKTCEAGKVINKATGNCVKASTIDTTLAACPEGKYRNPETNRCKNIEDDSTTLAPCQTGYERNPETNRCKKVVNNDGTDYELTPSTGSTETVSTIAVGAIAAVGGLGAVYVAFQFRKEIFYTIKKLLAKIGIWRRK